MCNTGVDKILGSLYILQILRADGMPCLVVSWREVGAKASRVHVGPPIIRCYYAVFAVRQLSQVGVWLTSF